MPVVEVEWIDSSGSGGWRQAEDWERDKPDLACTSAGYLFSRDKERIRLALSRSAHGSLADFLDIPTFAVRKVTVLKPASKKR